MQAAPCDTTVDEFTTSEASTSDPWAQRSAGMRCASCMWFNPKRADTIPFGDGSTFVPAVELGRCRRHAPIMSGFPVVFVTDWCGDHKLNENWVASRNEPPSPITPAR